MTNGQRLVLRVTESRLDSRLGDVEGASAVSICHLGKCNFSRVFWLEQLCLDLKGLKDIYSGETRRGLFSIRH